MQYKHLLYGAVIAAAMGLGGCGAGENLESRVNLNRLKVIHAENSKTNATKNIKLWIDEAFKDARAGKLWYFIKPDLNMANVYANDAGIRFKVDLEQLEKEYAQGVKTYGRDHAKHWADEAFKKARAGFLWIYIESDLDRVKEYAQEAGLELEEVVDNDSLQQLYAQYKRK